MDLISLQAYRVGGAGETAKWRCQFGTLILRVSIKEGNRG